MECRSRARPEQFAALLKFMECHGDISRPQHGLQGRIKADILWQELGEQLNSIAGGVLKPLEKWKKVWADWKAKTKKKALGMRREACATGSPSSKQTLTAFEQRVLGIIGFSLVVIQAEILEKGCDDISAEAISLPQNRVPVQTERSATDRMMLDFISTHPIKVSPSMSPPTGELPPTLSPMSMSTPAPALEPVPSAIHSSTAARARRRRLIEQRRRKIQNPYQRATSEYIAIEQRRLELEENRETLYHQREMERLQLESRRITMEENRNEVLSRLATIIDNLTEILPHLRPSSP